MIKTIFLEKNQLLDAEQEIYFLNYLVGQVYDKFFKKFIPIKRIEYVKESYLELFSKRKIVLVPLEKLLKNDAPTNIFEIGLLRNPKKLAKQPLEVLEKYFYVYNIQEANLVNLDKKLSKLFSINTEETTALKEIITILDSTDRLSQYKDIVYGIASNKVFYNCTVDFVKYMQKELEKLCKQKKIPDQLLIYYVVGTTAISLKKYPTKFFERTN